MALVEYSVQKGIAVLELNDPPANTHTYEMMQELDDCILKARSELFLKILDKA